MTCNVASSMRLPQGGPAHGPPHAGNWDTSSTPLMLLLTLAVHCAAGLRSDGAHQRPDHLTQGKPRTHLRLALRQPGTSSRVLRGRQAARRYAHTFSPGRSAAPLASRRPMQLWGMRATRTQPNPQAGRRPGHGQERQRLGTQRNAHTRIAQQRNARAGDRTRRQLNPDRSPRAERHVTDGTQKTPQQRVELAWWKNAGTRMWRHP